MPSDCWLGPGSCEYRRQRLLIVAGQIRLAQRWRCERCHCIDQSVDVCRVEELAVGNFHDVQNVFALGEVFRHGDRVGGADDIDDQMPALGIGTEPKLVAVDVLEG
ncbi:hypothetical protein D3C81_1592830 [compost metagenome]